MGNETTALKRPNGGRRGGSTGRQVVGDYAGQRAGDAAQAVRRAGLRPGLERSFGCDPSLLGLVVSQEPRPGSALARNGMVTLHVAAPSNANSTSNAALISAPAGPTTAPEPPPPAGVERAGSVREPREAVGGVRRRRKPGLSGRAPRVFETAPAPRPPVEPALEEWETGESWEEPVEVEPAVEVDGTELSDGDVFDGLTEEEIVVRVDGVFAARAGRWWASRRRSQRALGSGRGVRERLSAHPWLAASSVFGIGLWVLLGAFGALAGGQHAGPRHPAGRRLTARVPIARVDRAGRPPVGRPVRRHNEPRRRAVTQRPRAALPTRRAHTAAGRPASAPRPVVEVAAASAPAAPVQRAPAAVGVPVRANEPPPPPAPERTSGGLFSP